MNPIKIILTCLLTACCIGCIQIEMVAQTPPRVTNKKQPPATGTYKITEVLDTVSPIFKQYDVIDISMTKGLRHYRGNKLLNTYKIIPDTITVKRVAPCQRPPCPEFTDFKPVFYMNHVDRHIAVSDLENKSYLTMYGSKSYPGFKSQLWCVMKKIKSK